MRCSSNDDDNAARRRLGATDGKRPGLQTTRLESGSDVTVRLVKDHRSNVEYPAVVLHDDGDHVVVRAPWAGAPAKDLGIVRFEHGDVFTEHYWRDRWYAVKQVHDSAGMLKGWYCDVSRPARVHAGIVEAADLYLDLWMSADGNTIVRLDEDEFAASGFEEEEPEAADRARRALDELEHLARAGDLVALLLFG